MSIALHQKKRENNFSFSKRYTVLQKSGGKCWYCGVELVPAKHFHFEDGARSFTVDHIVNYGGDDISNLVPACRDCNNRKKGKSIDDFRKSQAVRFGYVFSEAQREFWQSKGVTLPGDEPHFFYFERMGLIP
jgi:5-methylcytosine-specific restriction endonuclease McrA